MAKQSDPLKTPMMKQYLEIKKEYQDAILFYRLGDFYEMFFDDAIKASEILNITLTSRHKEANIPLAGIPYHSAENYLKKLIDAGEKVVICEQIGKPVPGKTVKREVVRVLTPGTVVQENVLDETNNNFILSIAKNGESFGLVWADVSCGELLFLSCEKELLQDNIKKISPKEIVVEQDFDISKSYTQQLLDAEKYDLWVPSTSVAKYLEEYENVFEGELALKKSFLFLLFYLDSLYFGNFPPLREPFRYKNEQILGLDANTILNLEIEKTLIGANRKGSLLWAIDSTLTSMGKRFLRTVLKNPLTDIEEIKERQNIVSYFYENFEFMLEVEQLLKNVKDFERTLSRVLVKRGGPREIKSLALSIENAVKLRNLTKKHLNDSGLYKYLLKKSDFDEKKAIKWNETFVEEPPFNFHEGKFVNNKYSKEIIELYNIIDNSRELLLELENKEKEKTKIPNLKVGFTRVFGYYIEIPKRFADMVPEHYIRKQTTRNAERYFTSELKVLEEKILNAREIVKEKEMKILEDTVVEIEKEQEKILNLAKLVAWSDLFFSFAKTAKEKNYCRPKITTYNEIKIEEGRHPVVEAMIDSEKYVPATVEIGTKNSRMCIITGPNMGGKSTIMRMVALTTLLAQTGSFVPAKSAEIGIVDAIFTRVGASDNLSKGESTFLVEMKETAFILKNATKNSLVILDEIGRGTGTYDGISIAKAVVEYIIEKIGAITLFATHYHILTEMSDKYNSLENFHMSVRKIRGKIHFLYQLVKGGSSRSFGVEVAKLAKMPEEVVKSAEKILKMLENIDRKARFEQGSALQTDIFSFALENQQENLEESPVLKELSELVEKNNPDNITPRQALEIYYKVVDIIKKGV